MARWLRIDATTSLVLNAEEWDGQPPEQPGVRFCYSPQYGNIGQTMRPDGSFADPGEQ